MPAMLYNNYCICTRFRDIKYFMVSKNNITNKIKL